MDEVRDKMQSQEISNAPPTAHTKGQAAWITGLIFAGLPLLLAIVLFIMNWEYPARMFLPCFARDLPGPICSQPCGWMMTLVFGYLVLVSLFGVRGSFIFFKKKWWIAAIMIFILAVVPAIFCVLLGPAALVVMETQFVP